MSATSWLEMLTRSAMKRRYLCPFVSTLVPVGTGVDNRGQEWTSWVQFGGRDEKRARGQPSVDDLRGVRAG